MSGTPGRLVSAAPLLGQHNQAILGEQLGYSAVELEALRSQGVI
jgi:formyl-CoA transferase